jgi:hypothetical protein
MKIVAARPPNFDAIAAVFPEARQRGVIFTFGDTLYNPAGGYVSAWLKAHEGVHYSRQTNHPPAIEQWWKRYLEDPEFRLAEEIPAHRAEWKAFASVHKDRNQRAAMLQSIARRLASPLYGELITFTKAKKEIAA